MHVRSGSSFLVKKLFTGPKLSKTFFAFSCGLFFQGQHEKMRQLIFCEGPSKDLKKVITEEENGRVVCIRIAKTQSRLVEAFFRIIFICFGSLLIVAGTIPIYSLLQLFTGKISTAFACLHAAALSLKIMRHKWRNTAKFLNIFFTRATYFWFTDVTYVLESSRLDAPKTLYCIHPHGVFAIGHWLFRGLFVLPSDSSCSYSAKEFYNIEKVSGDVRDIQRNASFERNVFTENEKGFPLIGAPYITDPKIVSDNLITHDVSGTVISHLMATIPVEKYPGVVTGPFLASSWANPGFWVFHWLMGIELCSSSKKEMKKMMSRGKSLVLFPGGFHEATISCIGKERLRFTKGLGYMKYAIQNGYRVVPVYCIGETDSFYNVQGMWKFRAWLNDLSLQIPAVLPFGNMFVPFLPKRIPMLVLVGEAMEFPYKENPTREEVEEAHRQYVEKLTSLYNRYKGLYTGRGRHRVDIEMW